MCEVRCRPDDVRGRWVCEVRAIMGGGDGAVCGARSMIGNGGGVSCVLCGA